MKNTKIGFRARPEERQQLEELARQTGQGLSEVLRALVRNAKVYKVETLQPTATLTYEGLQDE